MTRLNPTVNHDAAWWDAAYDSGHAQRWTIWNDALLVYTTAFWLKPEAKALLVACGVGHATQTINARWFGIDFSGKGLDAANGSNLGFRCIWNLNSYPWPFRDEEFHFAICSEILESLDDPAAAVRECQRIARRTMITLPISMDLLSAGHKWVFDRSDAEVLLPGCEVVELRGGKLLACFQRM